MKTAKFRTGGDDEIRGSVEEMLMALAADVDEDVADDAERAARRAELAEIQSLFNEVMDA